MIFGYFLVKVQPDTRHFRQILSYFDTKNGIFYVFDRSIILHIIVLEEQDETFSAGRGAEDCRAPFWYQ